MEGAKNPGRQAFVLAIGTKSEKLPIPKEKLKSVCDKAMIEKPHKHPTRDMLTYSLPSLVARQDILVSLVQELGKDAASVAIKEWGQPKSKITHLIFHSTSGVHMPGADCRFTKLLGLPVDVKRTMLCHQGSYVGSTLLRMAKDTAENNPGARILVVCSEITLDSFNGLCDANLGSLLAQAIIGNGAAALIVGADPDPSLETPLFELMSASQMIIPDSGRAIEGSLGEMGLTFRISESAPKLISGHTDKFLRKLSEPYGRGGDWNSFFWAIHTGGQAILDQIQATLKLNHGKLEATKHVLSESSNIGSASVFFILDEIRGQGGKRMEWGILFAFGAGVTLDAVLLRRT